MVNKKYKNLIYDDATHEIEIIEQNDEADGTHRIEIVLQNDKTETTEQQRASWIFFKDFLKAENIINSFIALLTLVSVVFVWLTLNEMKKQRESAYRPVVVIEDAVWQVDWKRVNEIGSSGFQMRTTRGITLLELLDILGITSTQTMYGYPLVDMKIPKCELTVKNIGLGVAKNIKLIWDESNYNNLIEYYKNLNIHQFQEYSFDVEFLSDGDLMIIRSEGGSLFGTLMRKRMMRYLEVSGNSSVYPTIDMDAYGNILIISLMNVDSTMDTSPLPLKISYTYEDIYGKTYKADALLHIGAREGSDENGGVLLIDITVETIFK